jgi:hypothetical protein
MNTRRITAALLALLVTTATLTDVMAQRTRTINSRTYAPGDRVIDFPNSAAKRFVKLEARFTREAWGEPPINEVIPEGGAAGLGYQAGDLLTLVGGVHTQPALLTVTAVDAAGSITSASVTSPGAYSVYPETHAVATGGTGTGAGFVVRRHALIINFDVSSDGGANWTQLANATFPGGVQVHPRTGAVVLQNVFSVDWQAANLPARNGDVRLRLTNTITLTTEVTLLLTD